MILVEVILFMLCCPLVLVGFVIAYIGEACYWVVEQLASLLDWAGEHCRWLR